MATDATRDEAINWCVDQCCDFIEAKFPPPEGWAWVAAGNDKPMHLHFFSWSTNYDDINESDVFEYD